MKYWGLQPEVEDERYKPIVKSLGDDFSGSIVELACGSGSIISKIQEIYPGARCIGVDIESHPDWKDSKAEMIKSDFMEFIKNEEVYEVVIFLNSFRNWNSPDRENFVNWLDGHAKQFVTSTNLRHDKYIIGKDMYDVDMELYKIK